MGRPTVDVLPAAALPLVEGYCERLRKLLDAGAGADVSAQYGDAMVRRAALRELAGRS